MHLTQLLKTYIRLRREMAVQKSFNQSFTASFLAYLEQKHDGHFTPTLRKKIESFYTVLVPTVLCSSYCALLGKPFTDEERKRATIISIMTPVYDDFFDDHTVAVEDIEKLTLYPRSYPATSFEEKVFCELQGRMLQEVPRVEAYKETFQQVYKAQLHSLQQNNPAVGEEELYLTTYAKCYYAFLLYHDILDVAPSIAFKEMLYPFSGLLQIGNDAFDVYKDLKDGIYTLPNRGENFNALKKNYLMDAQRFNELVAAMPGSNRGKEHFRTVINLIIARGWVAMLGIEKAMIKYGSKPNLQKMKRSDLITDMEKVPNILRWLRFTYTFLQK